MLSLDPNFVCTRGCNCTPEECRKRNEIQIFKCIECGLEQEVTDDTVVLVDDADLEKHRVVAKGEVPALLACPNWPECKASI